MIDIVQPLDRRAVIGDDLHAEGVQTLGQQAAVVAHADNARRAPVESAPALAALHAPSAFFLGGEQLFRVVAALEHEIDGVLGQHRGAASGRAGHGDAAGKDLRPGGAVEPRMVALDPFEAVFSQQAGVHVAHHDGHVSVSDFLGQTLLIVEIHIDKFGIREDPAQLVHILPVVPDGGDDLVDLRHG